MPDANPLFQELWRSFYRPVGLEPVLEGYGRIDQAAASGELTTEEAAKLRARAFDAMRVATVDAAGDARKPILELLLPQCLLGYPSEFGHYRSSYREELCEWLEGLTEPLRSDLRDEVLARICNALARPDPEPACWTIGAIGFRNTGVVEALWNLASRRDDEPGDIALATLSRLGLPRHERERLVSALHERAAVRCNLPLIGAIRRLRDTTSLDVVSRAWMGPDSPESQPENAFLILRIPSDVAEEAADQIDVQDRAWAMIRAFYHSDPQGLGGHLYTGGDLAPRCDSPSVIPDILRDLTVASGDADGAEIRRTLLYERVEGCVHPRQLEGWLITPGEAALEIIRADACRDTGPTGRYRTTEDRLKESALNVLLSLGDASWPTSSGFETIVAGETSPHIRREVGEVLACFRLDPVPPTAVRWVEERSVITGEDPGDELSFRSAATRILRSAATHEAFDALLNFGFSIDGYALLQSLDAVSDVALTLAARGDPEVVNNLVEALGFGRELNQRVAAAEALIHLAAGGFVGPRHGPRLVEALKGEVRDEHELCRIVEALGYLRPELVTPDVEDLLRRWALGEGRTSWRALETLARHGRLIDHPDLLTARLGLRPGEGGWALDPGSKASDAAATVLGLLHARDPEKFLGAIRETLRTKDWVHVAGLAHLLDRRRSETGRISPEVVEALVERIWLRQTRTSAETELFDLLARWDPDALALGPWVGHWDDWLPAARVSLADALGEAAYSGERPRDLAVARLLALTGDGRYEVRRAAYRALARLSPDSLLGFVGMSAMPGPADKARPPALELRRRGAEACAWLPREAFDNLFERFATDPEPSVRETAQRARVERRERADAGHCLDAVLRVHDGTAAEILSAWRYGRALMHTGDDAVLRSVRAGATSKSLPPNIRHWLSEIGEGIERHWRDVTRKWPEPWFQWRGAIEEGKGSLVFSDGMEVDIRYSFWKQPGLNSSEASSWGGAAWIARRPMFLLARPHDATLVLANGARGRVQIYSSSLDQALFAGNGPYPS